MAMVVDVGALTSTSAAAAAAACRCKHGASSSSSGTPCVVGMGGSHLLPVCRGLRKVSAVNKRAFEPIAASPARRSTGIVAEVQEAASPGTIWEILSSNFHGNWCSQL